MKRLAIVLLCGCAWLPAAVRRPPFPAAAAGWRLSERGIARYHPGDLHRYIDGGSELYISYGFRELRSATYECPGEPDLVVDLFDMGTAARAFGIFAHGQENPDDLVGQGSESGGGLLRFWKDRYYVTIQGESDSPQLAEAERELGRLIAAAVPHPGRRPDLLQRLPADGLQRGGIRYFFHPAWQNAFHFIADGNPFAVGRRSPAALARYHIAGSRPLLLLVSYPSAAAARRVWHSLRGGEWAAAGAGRAVRRSDGSYCAVRVAGRLAVAVFRAADAASAEQLLALVKGD